MNPRLQVIAAAVLFSTGGAAIKMDAFSGIHIASVRSAIAAAALLFWVRGRIAWTWPTVAIAAVYAATLILFVTSTKLTTAANAIFLQATAPLYIVLLAPVLLGERFRSRDLVFLAAVAAGLALCFAGAPEATVTAPDPATGNLLGVICGLTWACTLMGLRWGDAWGERRGERHGARVGISAVVVGNAIAFAVGVPFLSPLPAASVADWATLAYLGVFQIGVAYIFLTSAVAQLPALDVSLLLLLEPVLNPIWTWLVRDEEPGTWTLVGGAMILVATAGKAFYDSRMSPAATKDTKT